MKLAAKRSFSLVLFLLFGAARLAAHAQDAPPPALLPFVDEGSEIVVWREADLDGNGRVDFLLVQQRKNLDPGDMDSPESRRVLKLLVAQKSGGHRVAAVNARLVLCQVCGGVWPDPLDSIVAGRRTFTVAHYGGSRWRWSNSWRFDYAPATGRWWLSKVTEGYDTETDGHQVLTYRRGRHIRDVSLEDFNPDLFHSKYLRKGPSPRPVTDESRS